MVFCLLIIATKTTYSVLVLSNTCRCGNISRRLPFLPLWLRFSLLAVPPSPLPPSHVSLSFPVLAPLPPRLFFRLRPFRGFAHVALSTVCGAWLSPLLSFLCLALFASFPSFSFCSLRAHPAGCSFWACGRSPGSARALVRQAVRLCSGLHCLGTRLGLFCTPFRPTSPFPSPFRPFPLWRPSSFT